MEYSGKLESVMYDINGKKLPNLIDAVYEEYMVVVYFGKNRFRFLSNKNREVDHILFIYIPDIETSTISINSDYGEMSLVFNSEHTRYDKKWTIICLTFYKDEVNYNTNINLFYIDPVTENANSSKIYYNIINRKISITK